MSVKSIDNFRHPELDTRTCQDRAAQLFDSTHGEAGDKAIHKKVVEDGDGDAGDEAAGHERPPEVYITVNQKSGHTHAHGEVS